MNLTKSFSISLVLLMMATTVFAAGQSPPVIEGAQKTAMLAPKGSATASGDKELASKHAEFSTFAHKKIMEMNRNLRLSRSRMQVTKQADGSWRALYHQIDDKTLTAKIRRSQSKSIPYVGVIAYQEQVFEARSNTPDQFSDEQFVMVQIIPNRHIFSYNKGAWK
jgi:hypothetical protein